MTEFLLLLSLWPFHHKKLEKPYVQKCYTDGWMLKDGTGAVEIPCGDEISRGDGQTDQSKSGPIGRCGAILEDCISPEIVIEDCTKQDGLYYYVAEDGVIAFSHAGCDAAKSNSKIARTLNQVEMSKI